jgi:hypothetical protein
LDVVSEAEIKMMNWDALIDSLTIGDIVPVIGDDLILVKNKEDKPIPLHRYIAEELTQQLDIPYSGQRIGELDTAYPTKNIMIRAKAIYHKIPDDLFCVEPIEKLAAIVDIKFYISTALDHRLEKALCKKRIIQISQVETINYSLQSGYRIPFSLDTGDDQSVTVFNLLGNLRNISESAFTEECSLEHFFSLSDQKNCHPLANYFMKRVKGKILLFIGLDFPDWFMRFIIRIMTNQRYSNNNILTHFIFSDEINKNKSLTDFLSKFKILINPEDMYQGGIVTEFVDELHRRWADFTKNYPVQYEGSIFLSYNHADQEKVKTLKQLLKTNGIRNVWFDIDDLEAGEHKPKIEEEIRKCSVFVPLLSNYALTNNQGYMWKVEWAGIESRLNADKYYKKMSFQIIPVILDDTARGDERIPEFMRKFAIWDLDKNKDRIIEEITKELTPIMKK